MKPAFEMPTTPPAAAPQAPVVPPPPPPQPATAPTDVQVNLLVSKYRQLRDKKKDIADRHREELSPYNDALKELDAMLLDYLNRTGQESAKTSEGTVYKSVRSGYTVADPAELREWLEKYGRWDLLETRVSKDSIEELLRNGESLPPGLRVNSEVTVGVRAPTKK